MVSKESPLPSRSVPIRQSKTAFDIPSTQVEDIIRTCAYHRKDIDQAVISFPPHEHADVGTSIKTTFRDPTTTWGKLEDLPLELIDQICLQLDIPSVLALRQTNLRGRQIVSSITEYKVITKCSLDCLCAILRTQVAERVMLSDFYRLLRKQNCSLCGDRYGNLVYLLTWIRCCHSCMLSADYLRMVDVGPASRNLKISEEKLRKLPTITTLPGAYSFKGDTRSRYECVRLNPVLRIYRKEYGEKPGSIRTSILDKRMRLCNFLAFCALPTYNPPTGKIQYGVSCAGCQAAFEDGKDVVVNRSYELREMVYADADFLQHFKWCEPAQLLWKSSDGGAVEPAGLPEACKRGGFFDRS